MGYASNQWLNRGRGQRNRSYDPRDVSISCEKETGTSWKGTGAVVRFKARKSDGEFQLLHLFQAEVDACATTLVESMSEHAREKLLQTLLGRLKDGKLLTVLATDLTKRRPKHR